MFILSPVVVTGISPFTRGALGALAAKPKPKPRPKRPQPRRPPPKKKPAPRRPPRRSPLKKPVRISPAKIAKTIAKRFPLGRLVEFSDYLGQNAYKTLERALGGPLKFQPKAKTPGTPFISASPRTNASAALFPMLEPVIVRAPRANPLAFSGSPYIGDPLKAPNRRPQRSASPKKSPLTRTKAPGAKSQLKRGTASLFDFSPAPKEELARDRKCPPCKKRSRKKCPDRGYKLVCNSWSKQKCL